MLPGGSLWLVLTTDHGAIDADKEGFEDCEDLRNDFGFA